MYDKNGRGGVGALAPLNGKTCIALYKLPEVAYNITFAHTSSSMLARFASPPNKRDLLLTPPTPPFTPKPPLSLLPIQGTEPSKLSKIA